VADNAKQKAEFALDLDSEGLEQAAKSSAGALERLREQIDDDTRALAAMQRAMRNLQGGSVVNVAQFRKLKEQIDLKRDSIAKAQSSYLSLGGNLNRISSGSGRALESRLAAITKNMQGMPGPIGGVVSRLGNLRALVAGGGAIALGIAAIAAALVALVAATALATRKLYDYGKAQAEARRSELLRLEGLTKLRFWFQRIPGNAKEMQTGIDQVAASSALGRDEIAKYNDQLYRLGLRGDNLRAALEGVAIKASAQGDAAAQHFAGWAATIGLAGGNVRKLSDDVKARLGGIADRQLMSSEVQAKKLQEAYAALFSGLELEEHLRAWQKVNALLSQNTASGRALKQILEHVLQPLIDASTEAAPIVKRFFQGMILGALRMEIAILDLRLWFKRVFGDVELFKGLDKANAALLIGKVAVYGLAAAFGLLGLAIAGAFTVAFGPLLLLGYGLFKLGWYLGEFVTWFEAFDWGQLGSAILDGITKPLKAGYTVIGDTLTELADGAIAGWKTALGIASPSKVFAELGLEIPRGVAVGVRQGSPEARESVDAMVATPQLASAAPASTMPAPRVPAAAGRAPVTVNVGDVHIHTTGETASELEGDIRRQLEAILQSVALQLGAPPEGEPA